jgi:hypothetical protein
LKTTGPLETVADEVALFESSKFAYSESPALGAGTEFCFDIVLVDFAAGSELKFEDSLMREAADQSVK